MDNNVENRIQCLLSFYDRFQPSAHHTFPIHASSCLDHPRQIEWLLNLLRTLLGYCWDLVEEIVNQDMTSLWHFLGYSNLHPSDIFCWFRLRLSSYDNKNQGESLIILLFLSECCKNTANDKILGFLFPQRKFIRYGTIWKYTTEQIFKRTRMT